MLCSACFVFPPPFDKDMHLVVKGIGLKTCMHLYLITRAYMAAPCSPFPTTVNQTGCHPAPALGGEERQVA